MLGTSHANQVDGIACKFETEMILLTQVAITKLMLLKVTRAKKSHVNPIHKKGAKTHHQLQTHN